MRQSALPLLLLRAIQRHAAKTVTSAAAGILAALSLASLPAAAQTAGTYSVTNLVSDGSVAATVTDPNFINPWAISASSTWWISAQGTGFNYVVSAVPAISFKVIVPAQSGLTTATGLPSGSVSTAAATGMLLTNGTKASFIFSTLDGTISGWNSKLGTANAISTIMVNNSTAGAVYTGLAIVNNATGSFLLAPNFGTANKVEVYDSTFKPATLAGSFTDPSLPSGYSPYAIHVIGTQVYVTYAVRTTATPYRTVNTTGDGIVSIFDVNGNFVSRAVTGGNLNAPWGVAIAPASFGIFSNDLLIGNFGNGLINAYDPKTFAYLGQLTDGTGKPLTYASLWDLLPGGTATGTGSTSVSAGSTGTVYFTAGLAGETHGLLAGISSSPTATGSANYGFSASVAAATVTAGASTTDTISVAPTNNFSGTVTLACSGLPAGATCTFSPSQLTVSPTASATGTVTIATSRTSASLKPGLFKGSSAAIGYALLLPFASILAFKRRSSSIRLLGLFVLLVASAGFISGCSSNSPSSPSTPGTPAGQSTVTITATSGAVVQSTAIALTVQ